MLFTPTLIFLPCIFGKLPLDPENKLGKRKKNPNIIGKLDYNTLKVVLCNCITKFQFAIKSMQSNEDFLSFDSL